MTQLCHPADIFAYRLIVIPSDVVRQIVYNQVTVHGCQFLGMVSGQILFCLFDAIEAGRFPKQFKEFFPLFLSNVYLCHTVVRFIPA